MRGDFAAFILSHGRPDKIVTLRALKAAGYTGRIFIVIDDLDKARDRYVEQFGDQVLVFDKRAIAKLVDNGDNFGDLRTTTHARNAIFDFAKQLGIKYFVQLDDDYTGFQYRFNERFVYELRALRNLDAIFDSMVRFLESSGIDCVCMAQGGEFLQGKDSCTMSAKRKAMNSFVCTTDRPFRFLSRLNEDVNTYVSLGARGKIFLTTRQISLNQAQTQATAGGMTDAYLKYGTYVKSFTTVMYQPSSVKVAMLIGTKQNRIHHRIAWKKTVPMILREDLRKPRAAA